MDLKLIKHIIDLISESEVDEVSIEEGDFKIKVKKTGNQANVAYNIPQAATFPPPLPPAPQQAAEQKPAQQASESAAPNGETVKSPIVGTYYAAPSPDDPPFIKEGDKVTKGQTLCIIEAMKIMNEIDAEFSGTVEKILVNNAQPVEFDQPLFIIKKD